MTDRVYFSVDEEMLLQAATTQGVEERRLWVGNGGLSTLDEFEVLSPGEIPRRYIDFLSGLPHILIEAEYVFVHAGLDFTKDDPIAETPKHDMLWIRDYRTDPAKLGGRTLVCGHRMTFDFEIRKSIELQSKVVCLDNGCWSKGEIGYGSLFALNLDTRELLVQENCE